MFYNQKSIIYIICPPGVVTGGPENINQLSYKLTMLGYNARLCFFPEKNDPYPEIYNQTYNASYIKSIKEIEDSSDNIVIVPEVASSLLCAFKNVQKGIFRLSVDNALPKLPFGNFLLEIPRIYKVGNGIIFRGIAEAGQRFKLFKKYGVYAKFGEDVTHLCQSYYAVNYLRALGVKGKIEYLSDYLHKEFIDQHVDYQNKKKVILYNPKIGRKFTESIIASNKDLEFIPLQNMSPLQIRKKIGEAMIYIDFGHHPGKDRLPREAAIGGCCVLTNRIGAANFDEDIPIGGEYKFPKFDPILIGDMLRSILSNFPYHLARFQNYRDFISSSEETLERSILSTFIKI